MTTIAAVISHTAARLAADENLVDDLADDPRRQRGGERNQAHHRETEEHNPSSA